MSIGKIIALCCPLLFFYSIARADPELHIIDYCKMCEVGNYDKLTYQVVSWNTSSTLPNPCYQQSTTCHIGVGFHPGNGEMVAGSLAGTDRLASAHGVTNVRTMGEVAMLYERIFGLGTTQVSIGPSVGGNKLCYAMKWRDKGDAVNLVPGSSCAYTDPGPPLNACYINGPITIDHGTVNTGSDSTKTISPTVFCLEKTQVRLRFPALTNDQLSLGSGGITTKLSLNGNSGTQGTIVSVEKARNTEFQIESYISPIPAGNTGLKQGSTALIVEFL
jgi:hypothetical protein